ncbi:MAG: DNA primase [Bacteroidales bacterium]|nr:DNA primase [Bacteroidales bacterium]
MIPKETVDKIFDAADIYDVIKDYVNLKRAGVNYKGNCPFHDEKTPSFVVSPSKGIYKCFGCGAAGNVSKFIMEHEKVSFPEALKILAKKYNIEIIEEELTEEKIQENETRDSLFIVTEFAKNFFKTQLHETAEGKNIALSYFKERGFRDDIIKKFELGWSPQKRDALTETALKKGYKLDFLKATGLTIAKDNNYRFDRFAERVIFPIHTLSGKVIAFGGRTLKADKKTAKYLNSPESEIYHKSKILYGIYLAKNAMVKLNKCYMVEGYTDVISMYQAGIENVVASSGTSLTVEQIKLVRRFTKNLSIIYDGDPAGIKASLRGIDLALAEEMNVRIIALPEGEDPDSFAKKRTLEELQTYISDHEEDFIKFKTELFAEEAKNDPVKRAQLIKNIVKSISVIPDRILREEYIRSTEKKLNVGEETLYFEVRKILRKNFEDKRKQNYGETLRQKPTKPQLPAETAGIYSEVIEKDILSFLLNYGNETIKIEDIDEEITVAEFIISEIKNDDLEFHNLIYKEIFQDYEKYFYINAESVQDYFLKHENDKISSVAAEILSPKQELSKIWTSRGAAENNIEKRLHEIIPELIDTFKLKIVQLKIEKLNKQLAQLKPSETYEEQLNRLLEELNLFNKLKVKLTEFLEKTALL